MQILRYTSNASFRKLLRRHFVGVAWGTAVGSLAMLPLLLMTSHVGPLGIAFATTVAIWLAAFLLASPFLIGVLLAWEASVRRWLRLGRRPFARRAALLCVVISTATVTFTALEAWGAVTGPDRLTVPYLWYRLTMDRELFGLLVMATAGWLLPPLLLERKVRKPLAILNGPSSTGSAAYRALLQTKALRCAV